MELKRKSLQLLPKKLKKVRRFAPEIAQAKGVSGDFPESKGRT